MKRINNYEFKVASYVGEIPEYPDYEIVRWYRNNYYQNEDNYIEREKYFTPNNIFKDRIKLDKSLFEKEEFCYSIVFFTYNNGKYILDKIYNNDDGDLINKDVITLINFGFNYLNNGKNNLHSSKE